MSELLLTARERVGGCELVAGGVRLDTTSRSFVIAGDPDERLALRLCRLATRVVAVEISGAEGPDPRAELTAVWHRVPHTRPVPIGAALALARSGAPTYLVTATSR